MSVIPVRQALVSVSDKSGLVEFAQRLSAAGVEIVSSGGTAAALEAAGLPVTRVSELTGFPEMLGGRVKTLHPRIHAAILADLGAESHRADLEGEGIQPIQLVVVNLYPFRETVAGGAGEHEAIEQIDIGGPALIRAAAKNHAWVGVVTDPARYGEVAEAVEAGGLPLELRRRLAREAFFHSAAYDAAIVAWLEREEDPPERLVVPLLRQGRLRYGENPHQPAALYLEDGDDPAWTQLQGKEMSYNNHLDAEAAGSLVVDLPSPACAIVKHTNPCGVAVGAGLREAFEEAWDCDPLSAFGGVVALNAPLDPGTAEAIAAAGFIEVLAVPSVEPGALERLDAKKGLRVLAGGPAPSRLAERRVGRAVLVQERDVVETAGDWKVVTSRAPNPEEWDDLRLAWVVAAHTKSNAIVIARGGSAVGIGAGDQSRVGAAERAVAKAGERARGAAAASDAFFPFRDGVDVLAAAGVTAVAEPGGSVRDEEVIAAAEEQGMALVFTGRRHFRH